MSMNTTYLMNLTSEMASLRSSLSERIAGVVEERLDEIKTCNGSGASESQRAAEIKRMQEGLTSLQNETQRLQEVAEIVHTNAKGVQKIIALAESLNETAFEYGDFGQEFRQLYT